MAAVHFEGSFDPGFTKAPPQDATEPHLDGKGRAKSLLTACSIGYNDNWRIK